MHFEKWLYHETLRIAELRRIYTEASVLYKTLSQSCFDRKFKMDLRELWKLIAEVADYEIELSDKCKIACKKHRERNGRARAQKEDI